MPELPEVQTIVNGLKQNILGLKIEDVCSDALKLIKKPKKFDEFKKKLIGRKINLIERRGKNILIRLSGNKTLLIHQKMTGHLLYGEWQMVGSQWQAKTKGFLEDPVNRFIHLIFFLDNGRQLALSDMRKFAKVELWDSAELEKSKEFGKIGPEPLDKSFTFKKFKQIISQRNGRIKQILMDQTVIAGIGNIYSDEILWRAKIYPLRELKNLTVKELKNIYSAMIYILKEAIKLKGDSVSDYRLVTGEKGGYQNVQKVYGQEGKKCPRCKSIIKRIKVGGRSAHFCSKCQRI